MSILAVLKLGDEFHRLIFSTAYNGAIDLKLRHDEVDRWFAGRPVYTELRGLRYPPQAYVMLWPLLGWLDLGPARWFWALTSVAALAWMAVLIVRESLAETRSEQIFVVLMLLSMNAVGVTIGNGQLTVHLLPAVVSAVLLMHLPRKRWGTDVKAAFLMLVVLVKPTLSLPFVWAALAGARRVRPFVLAGIGYVLLSFVAATFQGAGVHTLIGQWWDQARRSGLDVGYGDLHTGLAKLQLAEWAPLGSVAMLAALGIWTYRRRHVDVWILIGVAALTARLWSYHRVYDDALILLPLVALFRIAKRGAAYQNGTDVIAGALLAVGVTAMLAPARFELAAPPFSSIFIWGHVLVWLGLLFFLVLVAQFQSVSRSS